MAARVRLWRLGIRIAAFMLLVPLPPILYLSHFGFPDWLTSRLVDAADTEGYCLEMKKVRLDIFEGIVVERPRLLRKGVLGLPIFEASEAVIGFRILGATGPQRIHRITVKNGTLRPDPAPPQVVAKKEEGPGTLPAMECTIVLENCRIHHLLLPHLSCDLSARGSKLRLGNLRAELGSGERTGYLAAEISYNSSTRRFTGRTTSDFDPNELVTFLTTQKLNGLVSLIRSFEFPDRPPWAETRFAGCIGTNFALTVDAKVKARGFRRYGLDVTQGESQVKVQLGGKTEFVALCPLAVVNSRGTAEVDLTIDLINNTVSFIGTGNADPRDIMRAIDPATRDLLKDYHFGGPARYSARGFLNVTNLDICNIELNAEAKSFGLPGFVADECTFAFRRTGNLTAISNLQARIFGGQLSGSITFEPDVASTNMLFHANAVVDKVSFRDFAQALTGRTGVREGLVGKLSGAISLEGQYGKGRENTFNGKGNVTIRDGNLFQLPLFGQLSEMLARKIPGLGYVLRQDIASGAFNIVHGSVRSDALRIEGDILSLKAEGSYDIPADQLNFDVELRFLRNKTWVGEVLQTILLPVTKLFRVRLKGSLDNPGWSSVNF